MWVIAFVWNICFPLDLNLSLQEKDENRFWLRERNKHCPRGNQPFPYTVLSEFKWEPLSLTGVYYTRHPRFIVLAINPVTISQKGNEVTWWLQRVRGTWVRWGQNVCLRVCACVCVPVCVCVCVCVIHAESYLGLVWVQETCILYVESFLEQAWVQKASVFTGDRYWGQVWVVGFMKAMLCELWLFQENSDTRLHAHTHTYAHTHMRSHTHLISTNIIYWI